MSVIQVCGLTPLQGEISIQGSKNAVLPMMAAALLHRGVTVLTNVPVIRDVACMLDILESLGCRCCHKGDCLVMDARSVTGTSIPEEYVTAMRSSIVVLSALLGRMGEGSCCYPGGCLIGARPIDLHLMALRALGADIRERDGTIEASCRKNGGLKGTEIHLSYPSVGATEQAILASVLADGVTIIHQAAREPEISQMCRFLNNMGAVICGMGTDHLMVQGVAGLHDSSFRVEGDRIVAGTYGAAVVAADEKNRQIRICMGKRPLPLLIKTEPYPGFPTDLQSPFMAFLATAQGTSYIEEQVFEGRFATAKILEQMGAVIRTEDQRAVIEGHYPLKGAAVNACDLRGGAALMVAALAAEGDTFIGECHHIERGYEDICRDMAALGAHIRWVGKDS